MELAETMAEMERMAENTQASILVALVCQLVVEELEGLLLTALVVLQVALSVTQVAALSDQEVLGFLVESVGQK